MLLVGVSAVTPARLGPAPARGAAGVAARLDGALLGGLFLPGRRRLLLQVRLLGRQRRLLDLQLLDFGFRTALRRAIPGLRI